MHELGNQKNHHCNTKWWLRRKSIEQESTVLAQVENIQQINGETQEIIEEINSKTVRNRSLEKEETCTNCLESLFKPNWTKKQRTMHHGYMQ